MIEKVNGKTPQVHPSAFVAPGAVVLGDVELGPEVSVWYGCVLRADINYIRIGAHSNVQDATVCHVRHVGQGVEVGQWVLLGHRVALHSCTVEDGALIGIGAVVLDGARVGEGAVVAAGSVVAPGSVIPPRTLAMGVPAKPRREVSDRELAANRDACLRYVKVAQLHRDREQVFDFARQWRPAGDGGSR